jgi:hypothetical protein
MVTHSHRNPTMWTKRHQKTVFPHHGSHQQTWLQSDSYRKICRANFTNRQSFAMSNQLSSLHNTRSPAQVPITSRQKESGCSLLPIPGLQPDNQRQRTTTRFHIQQRGRIGRDGVAIDQQIKACLIKKDAERLRTVIGECGDSLCPSSSTWIQRHFPAAQPTWLVPQHHAASQKGRGYAESVARWLPPLLLLLPSGVAPQQYVVPPPPPLARFQ